MDIHKKLLILSLMLLPSGLLVAMQDVKAKAAAEEKVAGLDMEPAKSKVFVLGAAADQRVLIPGHIFDKKYKFDFELHPELKGIIRPDNEEEILLTNYMAHNRDYTIADVQRFVASLELHFRLNDYTLSELIKLAKLSDYTNCRTPEDMPFSEQIVALLPNKALEMLTAQGNNTPLQEVIRLLGGNLNGNLFEGLGEKYSALLKNSCLQLTQRWDTALIDTGATQIFLQETLPAVNQNYLNVQNHNSIVSLSPDGRFLAIVTRNRGELDQEIRSHFYFYGKINGRWIQQQNQRITIGLITDYSWSADSAKLALCSHGHAMIFERGPDNRFTPHTSAELDWLGINHMAHRHIANLNWHPTNNNDLIIQLTHEHPWLDRNARYIQMTKQEDGSWLLAPAQRAAGMNLENRVFARKNSYETDELGFAEFGSQALPVNTNLPPDRQRPMQGIYYVDQKGKVLRELSVNKLLFIAAYQHMRRANPARQLSPEEKVIINNLIAQTPVIGAAIAKENIPTVAQQATQHLFKKYPKTTILLGVCAAAIGLKLTHKAWVYGRKKLKWPAMPAWFSRLFRRQPAPVK